MFVNCIFKDPLDTYSEIKIYDPCTCRENKKTRKTFEKYHNSKWISINFCAVYAGPANHEHNRAVNRDIMIDILGIPSRHIVWTKNRLTDTARRCLLKSAVALSQDSIFNVYAHVSECHLRFPFRDAREVILSIKHLFIPNGI